MEPGDARNVTVLVKYIDGNEILNNIYKYKNKNREAVLYIKVKYGQVEVQAKCSKCEKMNYKNIDVGLF